MYNLEVCCLIFDHNTKGYVYLGSGKLNPYVISKTYPRPTQDFISAVERMMGEFGFFFLDPEDVRSIKSGAVWNFIKGTGLP
jgi:hypothetical protein